MGFWRGRRRLADTDASLTLVRARASRVPRPRWALAVIGLLAIGTLLFVEAYVSARFTNDAQRERLDGGRSVPADIREGGPIVDTTAGRMDSYRLPARTVALTFDDGPDPQWTPQILRVLREQNVKATFFVVGAQVARHPGLTRRIAAEGHELGVHTFTHPRLTDEPGWRRRLEYSQTQLAIAGAAGVTSSLLRPPYSSRADAFDDANWALVREAGDMGYTTVVNDLDSQDWARPGVDRIVGNATPEGNRGAVVLFHDAGGDRAQTVGALRRYIPELKAKGYRFTTVTGGLDRGLSRVDSLVGNQKADTAQAWRGRVLVWGVQVADGTMKVLLGVLILVGVLTLARTLLLFGYAVRHARRRRAPTFSWGPPVTGGVSILVPAHNEEKTIGPAVRSLAASDHPEVEVVVIDDGSTDDTARVVEALGLPNLRLVRVPGGGKAAALTTGLALSRHDLVVMVDADTVVDPDAIHKLVQPFADPTVGAVAGNVKVGNRRGLIARWQHIEYVIGFSLDRRLFEVFGCIPTVPGALGAFRRSAIRDIPLSDETLAEDTDLTMAVHRGGWRVVYEERAVARTEAPATLGQLWKQRYRWSYGTMQAMWKHRRALVERGPSGRFGRRGLPFIALFSVVLPLFAPVLDVLAVYGTFFLDRWETALGWLAILVVQAITAILAFRLDREPLRPLWALPLQQLAYRQIMYLVLLQSTVTALTGGRLHWQKLRRTGEAAAAAG